jgi:NAD+ diphosphatase
MRSITNQPPHIYAGNGFDRAAERRKDDMWLALRRADPATRVLPMAGLKVLIGGEEGQPRIVAPTLDELGQPLPPDSIFLGLRDGAPLFAAQVEEEGTTLGHFVEIRSVGPLLPAVDAGLLAYARGLAHWQSGHRFCGACGHPTHSEQGGHAKVCAACGREVFPRMDPAVIVLVTRGERCILGRANRFPPEMYSTLAGFVEVGESLEDTLRREIMEEVGIEIGAIRYRSSQPWPFPQSLMLGFRAEAVSETIRVQADELEDARWFERDLLRDEMRRPVRLPGPDSIARFLVDEWLAED